MIKKDKYTLQEIVGVLGGETKDIFTCHFQVIQNQTMSGDFWIIKSVNNPIKKAPLGAFLFQA